MPHHDGASPGVDLRTRFWREACGIIEAEGLSWRRRFDRLDGVVETRGGVDLAHAPTPPGAPLDEPGWLGGPHDPREAGFRGFVIHWRAGQQTAIHGHPDVMYVKMLSGRYRVDDYARVAGERLQLSAVRWMGPDDRCVAVTGEDGAHHAIHRITCVEDGQTLHLYSDDPAASPRYPDPDHG